MLIWSKTMNSDAEYPLEYSEENYFMLRRSVFDAMQTHVDDLEAELATVKESLTTAEATIDKLRDAIKGVGQFDVTGYCHMCDEYKMHNEECPHTVSALAAGGGK